MNKIEIRYRRFAGSANEYSVVLSEASARKAAETMRGKGCIFTARYVSVSEETGRITSRGAEVTL